jgi:hypothetical protein
VTSTSPAGAADFPHLPPGRRPGPQSLRTLKRRTFVAPFVGLVGTAMFAAGVWAAAGGRGYRYDRREELLGGLLFAAFGLLCVYAALVLADRGRPKRSPRLKGVTLGVSNDGVRRGDELEVTFAGGRSPDDRLEVGIACDERFDTEVQVAVKGTPIGSRQTSEAVAYEQWQAVPGGVSEHQLVFTVPPDAPYSYEGDCCSFAWRVSVRDARPLSKDPRHDEPIWVDP